MTRARDQRRTAVRLQVSGLVQGVGFRPFVHRLAIRHDLAGWVRNGSGDVQIEVEGRPSELTAFVRELRAEAPPLARIERLALRRSEPRGRRGFRIRVSSDEPNRRQPVSPDVAICVDCERELFDPADRRYRYPFITCTACGPRFTVIEGMPYDRERTSMAAFAQCPACLAEYRDPADRRHHSETNSCPVCGPQLWFRPGDDPAIADPERALRRAAALLRRGGIVALRGLGGFHLAADAGNAAAVDRLRRLKAREAKPFAVMVRTLDAARRLARIDAAEARLLAAPERPVVLVEVLPGADLAPGVAPGLSRIGLLLASTPLHHLLLDLVRRPLVMTSGNRSEEPIATGNDEALSRLGGIADGFLLHNREIVARYDDSVLRVVEGTPVQLRRARGYAPLPLRLPVPSPRPLLAVGPHLKNTFTLVHGADAFVSQHIGDLENLETLDHFRSALDTYRRLFRIEPEVAARDAHPGYLSTTVARELGFARIVAVQHHHAHIAAVLAEHRRRGPAIGVAFDGTGAGDDGTVWGAEFLIADLAGYRRAAHLLPAPLPGGDLAARTPWRAALGYLSAEPGFDGVFRAAFEGVDEAELRVARAQIRSGLNAPLASSMGRLFDAAAAILGLRRRSSYEGQAAMELEDLAGSRKGTAYPMPIEESGGRLVLDPLPLLSGLGSRLRGGAAPADLAADFHASVAWATARMVSRLAEQTGLRTAVLAGGCFQNARLLAAVTGRLAGMRIEVLRPVRLPPNDGAVSFGQAAVAAAILAAEKGG